MQNFVRLRWVLKVLPEKLWPGSYIQNLWQKIFNISDNKYFVLTLIWVGSGITPSPPCWFSSSKSETVKTVILEFCNIQWHFIGKIHAKFWIRNLSQSPDIGQNSEEGIYDFRISGQSLINENCCNCRTSNDIDMKLGPVTNLGKRTRQRQKNWWWRHVSKCRCQILDLWPIWSNLEAGFQTHGL